MSNVLCCPYCREVLLIGGENVKTQVQMLNEGVRENEDFFISAYVISRKGNAN